MARLFVIIMLLLIVGSLFSALALMFRDQGQGTRTARALTIRVSLSILLFLILLVSFRLGLIPTRGL